MDIIIASNNKGKISEFKRILSPYGYNVISQSEAGINIEVEETGVTFKENAKLKAEAIYNEKHMSVLADDSGLEVEYLNWEPGIYSARYKGLETNEERREYILKQLDGIETDNRKARYICCICFINENGEEKYFEGTWNGIIVEQEKGSNGFGYDPIFKPNGSTLTVAEMSDEEKNSKSHRAIATQKLLEYIKSEV